MSTYHVTALPDIVLREIELRLEHRTRQHEAPIVPPRYPGLSAQQCAAWCHVLGRTEEMTRWFARAAEHGAIHHAVLSRDPAAITSAAEHGDTNEGLIRRTMRALARSDDAEAKRLLERASPKEKETRAPFSCWSDMITGIVENDTHRFNRGVNLLLTHEIRYTRKGKTEFNSPAAFLNVFASAFCALAAARNVLIRIDQKFVPARIPILFIMVTEPIENPPSHVEVDLVPEVYRGSAPTM